VKAFQRVIQAEQAAQKAGEVPKERKILAGNMKTGLSLDTMITFCEPTTLCATRCYACFGRQAMPAPIRRTVWAVREMIDWPLSAAHDVCLEMRKANIELLRLFGKGDYDEDLLPFFENLASQFRARDYHGWGFTKKPLGYRRLNNLGFNVLLSLDATSPKRTLKFAEEIGYCNCAWTAMPDEPVPYPVRVVFPDHKLKHRIETRPADCPAVRDQAKCTTECQRCIWRCGAIDTKDLW
jgi:hypothetical protein